MDIVLFTLAVFTVIVAILVSINIWRELFKKPNWKKYTGSLESIVLFGCRVEGDETAWRTYWWNHWYLLNLGWKVLAVFKLKYPHEAAKGYNIGFMVGDTAWIENRITLDRLFKVRVGHEECYFFVISKNGYLVPITLIEYVSKSNPAFQDVPLH